MATKDEAMKQALEALELHGKQYPFTVAAQGYCLDAITTLRTAIEQAEKQEPVAWGFFFEDGEASNEMFDTREAAEKWLASEDCLWAGSIRPLYTTPPAAQPAVPEGWKLVPVEPTDAMVQAAHHLDLSYMPGQEGSDRAAIYRAMLAAAPAAPVQKSEGWMNALKDAFFEGFTSVETYNDTLLNSAEEAWANYKPPTTPPAAQPAAPLTPERIRHLVDAHVGGPNPGYPLDNSDWLHFARAVEAAHGIK